MGVQKSTYIGPYLTVKGNIESSTIKVYRVCPNHPNKKTDNKYCSECGSLIVDKEEVEIKKIDPERFSYQNFEDDRLYSPEGVKFFLPVKSIPDRIGFNQNGGSFDVSKNLNLIRNQMFWFSDEYKFEITEFQKAFGEDNVEVCWGVATYWS